MSPQRKLILYIAMSLDGYIATEDHGLDWLFKSEGEGDNGYGAFYETVDTILLGRKTYDWIMLHESNQFPYKGKKCYVFSRSANSHNDEHDQVEFVSEDVVTFTSKIKQQAGDHVWVVGGSDLLQPLLKAKLVDELIIQVAPKLIGKGIPLFRPDDYELDLSLTSVMRYNQFAELRYQVVR